MRRATQILGVVALIAAASCSDSNPQSVSTLSAVKARGRLVCGVGGSLPGFSLNTGGTFSGLDVDFCRAVAAAVLGDSNAVTFTELTASQRFDALRQGTIDVLMRNTTWTLSRDTMEGLDFVQTTFYDGQGFLVGSTAGIASLMDLNGKTICVTPGTTTESNLLETLNTLGITATIVQTSDTNTFVTNYNSGACVAVTSDRSALAGIRTLVTNPNGQSILDATISKEPLGPVVRQGDAQWRDIIQWVVFATLAAEELGVTSANAQAMAGSTPRTRRLLGTEGGLGAQLGLSNDWALKLVQQVGNYAEIYDRNLGPSAAVPIERGLNRLWNNGGLMYAPPFR